MSQIQLPNAEQIFEKYRKDFQNLDLHIYNNTHEEDLLLLRWWMLLIETGDIEKLIVPENRRLASFMSIFQYPTIMFYGLDSLGRIDFVVWFKDPSGSSIFCGLWSDPRIRRGKRLLKLVQTSYKLAFEFYETFIGITWQPEILQLHLKLGYAVTGNLANFMEQDTVWLVQLTKQNFYSSRFMQIGR